MDRLHPVADDRARSRERLTGILLIVLSASLFGLVDAISKLLTEHQSFAQIVWARYALGLPMLLLGTPPSALRHLFRTKRPGLQILRGLTPIGVSISMVFAVRYMPLAEATVILFAAPLFVVALSAPLLGELVRLSNWIAVCVGFAAVVMVARPGVGQISHLAVIPLVGAFFYAIMQIVTRRVAAAGERSQTTLAWTLMTGMVISTPLALALWEPLDTRGWLLMLSLGTVFGIAQLLMIRGFALAPAGLLAPLSYVQVVSAAILSVAIFGELLDVWTLLGIVMIVASGLYVVRERNAGSGRT